MIWWDMSELAATFIEVFLAISSVLVISGRQDKFIVRRAAVSLAVVAAVACVNSYKLLSVSATVVGITGIALAVRLAYKIDLREGFLLSVVVVLLIHMIDILSASLLEVFLGIPEAGCAVLQRYSFARACHLVLTKILLFASYMLFIKRHLSYFIIEKRRFLVLLAAWAMLLYQFGIYIYNNGEPSMTVLCVNLTMLLFATIYLFKLYSDYQQALRADETMLEIYRRMAASYRDRAAFAHDMKNYILVIAGLLEEKDYKRAEEYTRELVAHEHFAGNEHWTGIEVLDVLLADTRFKAEHQGIQIEICCSPVCLSVSDHDLTILFGNILRNALEACERMSSGTAERWIRIRIMGREAGAELRVSNSCLPRLSQTGGNYLSAKRDYRKPGFGISSIRRITEAWGGCLDMACEGDSFRVSVVFFDDRGQKPYISGTKHSGSKK